MDASFKDETTVGDKSIFRERRRSRLLEAGKDKWWATFPTPDPAVPFVEFTVVAPRREDAKKIARQAAAVLGLRSVRMD